MRGPDSKDCARLLTGSQPRALVNATIATSAAGSRDSIEARQRPTTESCRTIEMREGIVFVPDCCDAVELPITPAKVGEWQCWKVGTERNIWPEGMAPPSSTALVVAGRHPLHAPYRTAASCDCPEHGKALSSSLSRRLRGLWPLGFPTARRHRAQRLDGTVAR